MEFSPCARPIAAMFTIKKVMMKNRFPAAWVATLVLATGGLVDFARAEESFRPILPADPDISCSSPLGGRCARFQGYIYVRHGDADGAGPLTLSPASSAPEAGGGRLYLHVMGPSAR